MQPRRTKSQDVMIDTATEPYTNQVGGHNRLHKLRNLPFICKPLSENELAFYRKLRRLRPSDDGPLLQLRPFTPKFYSLITLLCSPYLVLQDLLHGYQVPCMLDVKLGRIQRSLRSSPEKRRRQLEKSLGSTSCSLGFRLCGSQSYNTQTKGLTFRDKYWGRSLAADEVITYLKEWFSDGISVDFDIVQLVLLKMTILTQIVSNLRHYRFWSSSVFWYYDGGLKDPEERLKSVGVKLIDFGNATYLPDNPSMDHDTVLGLSNLCVYLAQILASKASVPPPIRCRITERKDNRPVRLARKASVSPRRRYAVRITAARTRTTAISYTHGASRLRKCYSCPD